MSTATIYSVLSTEITSIPTWIKKISGNHFDNTLCNGATWMMVLWRILHIIYNKLMNGFLKKMGEKEHVRSRLIHSLWFLAFFCSALAYYLVTLSEEKMELFRGSHMTLNENLPTSVIVSYIIICTFYLHTAFLEGIQMESLHLFWKFLLLVAVCTSAYINRLIEIPFTLTALIGMSAIPEELTRVFYSLLNRRNIINYVFIRTLFILSLVLFVFLNLVIIPLLFLIPLGKRIIFDDFNVILITLFSFFILWQITNIYNSVLVNFIFHWLYHINSEINREEKHMESDKTKQIFECPGNLFECSLFPRRTDDAYILEMLRSEVNERKMEMVAKRKPKNRNMIIQTLKCMMVIKRKLSKKKMTGNSESDKFTKSSRAIQSDDAAQQTFLLDDEDDDDDFDADGLAVKTEEIQEENQSGTEDVQCLDDFGEVINEEVEVPKETNIKPELCDLENQQPQVDFQLLCEDRADQSKDVIETSTLSCHAFEAETLQRDKAQRCLLDDEDDDATLNDNDSEEKKEKQSGVEAVQSSSDIRAAISEEIEVRKETNVKPILCDLENRQPQADYQLPYEDRGAQSKDVKETATSSHHLGEAEIVQRDKACELVKNTDTAALICGDLVSNLFECMTQKIKYEIADNKKNKADCKVDLTNIRFKDGEVVIENVESKDNKEDNKIALNLKNK